MKMNRHTIKDYTHYAKQLSQSHSRYRMAEHSLRRTYNNLLRVVGMPSQTIHIEEETYNYISDTKDDGQSFSGRVRELLNKGKEVENNA